MDRRSFFKVGRKYPLTEWEDFCDRLQRALNIPLRIVSDGDVCAAQICLDRVESIQIIYHYCKHYHVGIALHGFASVDTVMVRHILFIAFSHQLNHIEPVGDAACLVQPSVVVGDLLEKGYKQFERVPPETTVVEWFANPAYHDSRPLHGFLSGVERLSALFSDGSRAVIGEFNDSYQARQGSVFLDECISELLELLADKALEKQLSSDVWGCDYRVDALAQQRAGSNLARVLLGHQGRLAWVQHMLIKKVSEDVLLLPSDVCKPMDVETIVAMCDINTRVKNIFDEKGVFLYDDELMR